jgi:hypothetical protein
MLLKLTFRSIGIENFNTRKHLKPAAHCGDCNLAKHLTNIEIDYIPARLSATEVDMNLPK